LWGRMGAGNRMCWMRCGGCWGAIGEGAAGWGDGGRDFSGTDSRAALGMAEVSLRFADCEQELGVDWNEVCVTRRVFRDGNSDYLPESDALPAEGYPPALHGYGDRAERVLDHGAGEDRPDSVVAAGGSAGDFRGGGRDYEIQVAEEGGAAEAGGDGGEPAAGD